MDDTANLFAQSNPDCNLSFAQMFCIHLISIRQHTEIIVFDINLIGIQSEYQYFVRHQIRNLRYPLNVV